MDEKLNSSKFNVTGGAVTGSIVAQFTNVDASKANNNISTTQWPTSACIMDKDARILTRLEGVIDPNGNISGYWYCRNYNTSGNQVAQKGIQMTMNKTGGFSYIVSDPDKFRSAIGAYTLTPRYVTVTVPANTANVNNVTASVPAGSTFLCWFFVCTNGFVSGGYMLHPNVVKATLWLQNPPGSQQSANCWYLTQS